MRATTTERFLSLGEVAERLGISDQTVRRWVKAGELPAYKPGKEWRIKDSDLEVFLETRSFPKVQSALPSPPETAEEGRRAYPYPWMADTLARVVDVWNAQVEARSNPAQSRTILIAALDVQDAVMLDYNKEEWEALPAQEQLERIELANRLEELAMRGAADYEESKKGVAAETLPTASRTEAQGAEVVDELEARRRRREEIRRRTAELGEAVEGK